MLVSFITIGCISNANQVGAVYLIPTGFEGPVVIIYDQAALAKPPIVDDAFVFWVPTDGLIRTSLHAENIGATTSYYFVGQGGDRRKIDYLYSGGPKYPEGVRTEESLSPDERSNGILQCCTREAV